MLTADALAAVLAQMTQRPPVVAILGDLSQIDGDALAKIGTVYRHEPADLFSYGPFPEPERAPAAR